MQRFVWLAFLALHPAWCQIFEGVEGDFIIPEGSCCQDHSGMCILKNCCDFRFMLRHVWRAIRHGESLQPGHNGCLGQSVEECCSVNRNYARSDLPWYNHGLLTIKVHSRRSGTDHLLKATIWRGCVNMVKDVLVVLFGMCTHSFMFGIHSVSTWLPDNLQKDLPYTAIHVFFLCANASVFVNRYEEI